MKKLRMNLNRKGVALMIVFSTITILSALMLQFTYSSAVFKSAAVNAADDLKAYYAAKAGLRLSILRIGAYQKVREKLLANKNLTNKVPPKVLEIIWSFPFYYPPLVPATATGAEKDVINQWVDEMGMKAKFTTIVRSESNKINLNRFLAGSLLPSSKNLIKNSKKSNTNKNDPNSPDDPNSTVNAEELGGESFLEFLENAIDTRLANARESDEEFYDLSQDWPEPKALAEAIWAWVDTSKESIDGVNKESLFEDYLPPLSPKNAPFWHESEIMLLPGWNDEIYRFFSNHFTTHAATGYNVNKVTPETLQMLFAPAVILEQTVLDELKEQRNDPEVPLRFNNPGQFWSWIAEQTGYSNSEIDTIKSKLTKIGVNLTTEEALFHVISQGTSGTVTRTLRAYVRGGDMEQPPEKKKKNDKDKGKKEEPKTIVLPPRLVFMTLE